MHAFIYQLRNTVGHEEKIQVSADIYVSESLKGKLPVYLGYTETPYLKISIFIYLRENSVFQFQRLFHP